LGCPNSIKSFFINKGLFIYYTGGKFKENLMSKGLKGRNILNKMHEGQKEGQQSQWQGPRAKKGARDPKAKP
jgi:hypothetical protein